MPRSFAALAVGTLALVVALSFASPVSAAPHGPAVGNNRYSTEIRDARGAADTDDYVARLLAGERLSVVVTATRKSELRPAITLVRPDGSTLDVAAKGRHGGRSVVLRNVAADATGPWTVRVSGEGGTQGAYTVTFKIRPAQPLHVRRQDLGGGAPSERTHVFGGLEGGTLDVALRWRASDDPVRVRALTDPAGGDVPGTAGPLAAEFALARTKATLRHAPLAAGDGDYSLALGVDAGRARYALDVRVTPPARPAGRRVTALAADEPYLLPVDEPVRGVAGQSVTLRGGGFATDGVPRVLFDGVEGTAVRVAAGGGQLDVVPPARPEGSNVEIAVINPDGQAAAADDYFHYAEPPVLDALLQLDGTPALGGDTLGGQTFRVTGSALHPEQTLRFGSAYSIAVARGNAGELVVTSPAGIPGFVDVRVEDPYGRASVHAHRFEYRAAPRFAASPYDPPFAPVQVAATVTVSGSGFDASDVLLFDGVPTERTLEDASTFTFEVPALEEGEHSVALRDRVGSVVVGPVFAAKGAPELTSVRAVGGAYSLPDGAPLLGGAEFEATGRAFHALDVVTLGGAPVTVTSRTFTTFRFTTPPGEPGSLELTVTDAASQAASLPDAVRRFGLADATAGRVPAGSAVDDLSAWRGALGDLDGDGSDDDLVLTSYGYYKDNVYRGSRAGTGNGNANAVGTRAAKTRILFGGADGVLTDATDAHFPAGGQSTFLGDDWNGMAVALGDLDGANGADIVVGGVGPDYTTLSDVRIFRNQGSGDFAAETTDPLPTSYLPYLVAYDENGQSHPVFTPRAVQGLPSALAIGDIDSDGDADVIVGRDWYDQTYAYIDPRYVDVSSTPAYVYSADAYNYPSYTFYYYAATQVFRNGLATGAGWSDVTATALPSAGSSAAPTVPAFHARDLALGDLDGDGDLDLVVGWDDPLSVTPYALYSRRETARVATRVLTNDGAGHFTDVTSSWLPAGAAPEFWQAARVALVDLDGDAVAATQSAPANPDLDLVLLLPKSVDAYLGTPTFTRSALRILRNDAGHFTDVTASALPALPTDSNDNFRGSALLVRDLDGDGRPDILVGTTEPLRDTGGTRIRATRLLLGGPGLQFRRGDAFLPAATVDSGEADELLLGDLAGSPILLRLSETPPAASPGGAVLRADETRR